MIDKDITWPECKKQLVYLGRNGAGFMDGISFFSIGDVFRIYPVNSKGNWARCSMEIPKDRIPEIITVLQEIIADHPRVTEHE